MTFQRGDFNQIFFDTDIAVSITLDIMEGRGDFNQIFFDTDIAVSIMLDIMEGKGTVVGVVDNDILAL